ncbi:MAG TPA: hypothetical protein VMK12_02850 [Anaeromyxobacteraceae bacterium]|nr:hypothetical protein [Anaeromyxobacteraceae bacterium]
MAAASQAPGALESRPYGLVSRDGAPPEVLRAYIDNQGGADFGPLAALQASKLTFCQGTLHGN